MAHHDFVTPGLRADIYLHGNYSRNRQPCKKKKKKVSRSILASEELVLQLTCMKWLAPPVLARFFSRCPLCSAFCLRARNAQASGKSQIVFGLSSRWFREGIRRTPEAFCIYLNSVLVLSLGNAGAERGISSLCAGACNFHRAPTIAKSQEYTIEMHDNLGSGGLTKRADNMAPLSGHCSVSQSYGTFL